MKLIINANVYAYYMINSGNLFYSIRYKYKNIIFLYSSNLRNMSEIDHK